MTKHTLLIRDIFELPDGTCVLAGELPASVPFVASCSGALIVDGEERSRISVDGEMLVEGVAGSVHRALTTRDTVELTKSEVENGRCELVLDS